MSTEVIAIIVSAIGIVLTLGSSFVAAGAWIVRRLDHRIDRLDEKLSTRIDTVDEKLGARLDAVDVKLGARIDAVDEKLSARIDGVARDVADLKVSVARLEGPPRHLLTANR